RHFNDPVVHIALHPSGGPEHDALAGVDVADDGAVQHYARHLHLPLDRARLAHRQRAARPVPAAHAADDAAIQVQAALELEVAVHARGLADQGVDPGLGIAREHAFGLRLDGLRGWTRRSTGRSAPAARCRDGSPAPPPTAGRA